VYESIAQLWSLLLEAANDPQVGEIACVIDALDECQKEDFMMLSKFITSLYMETGKTKLKLQFQYPPILR
jgi:ankyrin repeat domain-containing protein 50